MTQIAGRFFIRVINAETGHIRKELEFDNLVTDIGLEYYARGWPNTTFFMCAVGNGTNAPDPSNTTLGNQIARTLLSSNGAGAGGPPSYSRWFRLSGRFNAGAISNTITEIGIVHRDNNVLWCRQLILDEQGNPTSLVVLPNEFLDVSYTLHTYPNLQDRVFSFVLGGVTYNCIARLARAGVGPNTVVMNILPVQGQTVYSTQTLGDITSSPAGENVAFSTIANLTSWDSATPYTRNCTLTLALGTGNVSGGIGSMLVLDRLGYFYHQISFTPVLPKDATTTITLVFSNTVSRYSAP